MKKTLFTLLAAMLCLPMLHAQVWDGTTADTYAGGDGSEQSPYQIANGQQLAKLAQDMQTVEGFSKDKYFVLTADIVMNEGVADSIVRANRQDKEDLPKGSDISMFRLTPRIGSYVSDTEYTPFQGTFDGAGHTISGLIGELYSKQSYDALFIVVEKGTVKNLGITDSYLLSNANCGGLVGRMVDSRVRNCYVSNSFIEGGGSRNGALIGLMLGTSELSNCFADAVTFGKNDMGGMIGRIGNGHENYCMVDNCLSYVEVRVKRRNNGSISSEVGPLSMVRNSFWVPLGEAQYPFWTDYVYGGVENVTKLTPEECLADDVLTKLNSRAAQLPGACRWKKGDRHPVLDYSEYSSDDLPSAISLTEGHAKSDHERLFDLSGRQISSANHRGIVILKSRDAQGQTVTKKRIK